MTYIGIDVGSTYTKYCILDGRGERTLFAEPSPVRQKAYFEERIERLYAEYGRGSVVTCGYGRRNVEHTRAITELTALAEGAWKQCPECEAVLDIGGQDTKLICQEKGKLTRFFSNEKCAAGCGLFLGNVLHSLQIGFADVDLRELRGPVLHLSSVCAVFAQSEIVELIAEGTEEMAIVYGVLRQILVQAKPLLGKVHCSRLALSGGLTRIPGMEAFAARILERDVVIPEHAAYLSAIGCALRARQAAAEEGVI